MDKELDKRTLLMGFEISVKEEEPDSEEEGSDSDASLGDESGGEDDGEIGEFDADAQTAGGRRGRRSSGATTAAMRVPYS